MRAAGGEDGARGSARVVWVQGVPDGRVDGQLDVGAGSVGCGRVWARWRGVGRGARAGGVRAG